MKEGNYMNKKIFILFLCISVLATSILFYIINRNNSITFYKAENKFEKASIGGKILDNRDGYGLKLNNSFWVLKTYSEKNQVKIFKLKDMVSTDLASNSELFYYGAIDNLFCKEDTIIAFSNKNNHYVVIDCNNINNLHIVKSKNELEIDLSEYTEVKL